MTEQEFISHWVGTPWLERGNSKQGIDCWALVVRYYKDVLNINLCNDYDANFLQGYLFGKPMPGADFIAALSDR